jgi:GNAT superfamily N-acetyltransferase
MTVREYGQPQGPSPAELDEHIVVRTKTGRAITARPLACGDAALLVDLFDRLSEQSRRLRFSKPRSTEELVWREATRLVHNASQADATLVGVVCEEGQERAVALVQVVSIGAAIAEIAAVVRDDYQNNGLGKAICRLATRLAIARGIRTLQILTQAENRIVQWLVRSQGLAYTTEVWRGEVTIRFQLLA